MRELCDSLQKVKIAAPDSSSAQDSVGRKDQPVVQPAAQSAEQTRKELLLRKISGALHDLFQGEHSSSRDRAEASSQGDATPLSRPQEDVNFAEIVENLATLSGTAGFTDLGYLHPEIDDSGGQASAQVQKEGGKASVPSFSLSKEVPLDENLQISGKLQELQAMSKELEDLPHVTTITYPDLADITDEAKAQTGTAEEGSHIDQKNIGSRMDPENDKPTVSQSQIKGHFDGKKTTFDASKVHETSSSKLTEYYSLNLYSMCQQLEAMCEKMSCVLPSTLQSFVLHGNLYPDYARPCLHLAEVASLLHGFSSELHFAVRRMMQNFAISNITELGLAQLFFAIKKLTEIFPLLDVTCRSLYTDYLIDHAPSDCRKDTGACKDEEVKFGWKMNTICHQMDVADEQLGKAIRKMTNILDNEKAFSESQSQPVQPETDSQQVDPKEMFFKIAIQLLLIEEHISFLLGARRRRSRPE
jgi:hypothetical protein